MIVEAFDPDLWTPGVVGFFAIFFIALVTVFLILDMTRRIRRTRYRAEVQERIEQERRVAEGEDSSAD